MIEWRPKVLDICLIFLPTLLLHLTLVYGDAPSHLDFIYSAACHLELVYSAASHLELVYSAH